MFMLVVLLIGYERFIRLADSDIVVIFGWVLEKTSGIRMFALD